jgi:pyruvate kinase
MDAVRLNFSHGTHESHKVAYQDIRQAEKLTNKKIAVIQDLQGPKIRTGHVENDGVMLFDGYPFIITVDDLPLGNSEIVSTTYLNLVNEVKAGNTILLDDGYLILSVEKVDKKNIYTKVVKGGLLKNNKGIITPGVSSQAPSLSEKDIDDLKFGLEIGVDAVALSFVRSERDVIELRSTMKVFGRVIPVISKIERYEGVEDIVDIVNESDAIMVARGDLGLELPAEQVPVLQKEIIKTCNFYGKPVIIATQMLESMINNPRPTRAEASDVANAVIDGADCVMLSGETSVGKYPFDAVEYMSKIILAVEEKYQKEKGGYDKEYYSTRFFTEALGKAACVLADQINAKAIVALTESGFTALNISKFKPNQPVIAFTGDNTIARFFSIVRGIIPAPTLTSDDFGNIFDKVSESLMEFEFITKGDTVVLVAGTSAVELMPENIIKIHQIK